MSAFVRLGLDRHQLVLCLTEALTPARFAAELADRGVPVSDPRYRGQLVVSTSDESWLAGGGGVRARADDRLPGPPG